MRHVGAQGQCATANANGCGLDDHSRANKIFKFILSFSRFEAKRNPTLHVY